MFGVGEGKHGNFPTSFVKIKGQGWEEEGEEEKSKYFVSGGGDPVQTI